MNPENKELFLNGFVPNAFAVCEGDNEGIGKSRLMDYGAVVPPKAPQPAGIWTTPDSRLLTSVCPQ